MNRIRLVRLVRWNFFVLLLVFGLAAGCSEDAGPDGGTGTPPETTIEAPVEEPTVLEPTTKSPEELSRAQQQLDAQCAEMDIQEAQDMGMAPEEFGCKPDGTGIPVKEWLKQDQRGEMP